jgi:hypothetical protein
MNSSDYNQVKSLIKRIEYFVSIVKEKDIFTNLIGELEEDLDHVKQLFPNFGSGQESKLSRELSTEVVNFYGENSKWIRFVGGVDCGEYIQATITSVKLGALIGKEGELYNRLNELLNKKFNKRVHIRLKEEMWNHENYEENL